MAIEPINGVYPRQDLTTPRRQDQQAAGPTAEAGAASTNAPGASAGQRPNFRLQQMMQAGRETSALLSTLPGPNLSFFQPPTLPPGVAAQGPAGGGSAGTQRLNAPLLETMQRGRETSAFLSTLVGPNQKAFQAPTLPAFAAPQNQAGPQANAAGAPGAAGPLETRPLATGPLASGNLPRAGASLLRAEQAGRTTSTLLSALNGTSQPGGSFVSSFAQPVVGYPSGDSLAAMRTAQEVIQAVGTSAPSEQNMRIANEAYQMEAQAQQDYTRKAAEGQGSWEWFA
ncbi:MAG: hypothetical protein ABSG38_19655 [Spirochaetia bacterium]